MPCTTAKTSTVIVTPEAPKKTSTPAPPPPPPATTTKVIIPAPPVSTKVIVVVPTPEIHVCPTPGTYTFPATTITVSETTTVCAQETVKVVPGTHTIGGVTTIVETATTITCPYAKETTSNGVVTNVIESTVYVCPSAGTYTIAPITKTVTEETIIVYPVPTSYVPGTYCAPEQVVTVTETDFVYVCPYSQQGLPTTKVVVEVPPPKVTVVEAPPPKETVVEVPATTSEAEVTYTPSAKKPSGGSSNLQGTNDHYGITYTPYESSDGNCKSADAVDADIKSLKDSGFSIVRIYSTDCNTLETVGPACRKHGMEMIVGVFVKSSGCTYDVPEIKEQVDKLAEWAQWDMVKLFVVGNEAIMNGFCSADQLRELVLTVKEKCSGYSGRWTIAETLNIWERPEVSAALCDVVDVTGANIHPYFNPNVSPETAGEFVSGQLSILGDICPGNVVINLECGWPTRGNCNGAACPGEQEQITAIKSIRESCGDKTVFFSYEDDMWKDAGSCGCEQSWGSKACFA